ncbi:MAG: hypothetical protein IRY99_13160, partial [Isosphaeraceae bacterium]|nr:hypothetical protein [Isosphaeraceae bacterium]
MNMRKRQAFQPTACDALEERCLLSPGAAVHEARSHHAHVASLGGGTREQHVVHIQAHARQQHLTTRSHAHLASTGRASRRIARLNQGPLRRVNNDAGLLNGATGVAGGAASRR